ncbi:hypothetical protein P5673_005908 [Acropora cervicornis]|uniref:Uncharacterized protein n=1 Tax=Acropora cervicornis TaxID=6130 RepID=A0AAD9VC28_ACRCE|nr:hypothetical protein P5673_005908 [Acropora cervicornis]
MESLKVVFILSACFLSMGCGKSVSTESPLWDSVDDKFEAWSLQESAHETTTATGTTESDAEVGITPATQLEFKSDRLRRDDGRPESPCLRRFIKKRLPGGSMIVYPECNLTAAYNKCGATLQKYGARACELSHFTKFNDNGTIRLIPTSCSCKV